MDQAELEEEARQCLINPENDPLPTSLISCLYIGHFLSRWSARYASFYISFFVGISFGHLFVAILNLFYVIFAFWNMGDFSFT